MSKIWAILATFLSAILATTCCLPAFLFLVFGTSFSFLSIFEPLSEYRWFLSGLAVLFFVVFVWIKYFKKCQICDLTKTNLSSKKYLKIAFLGLILAFLLFYPEILGWIYA